MEPKQLLSMLATFLLAAACSGSGGGSSAPPPPPVNYLTIADVERIVAQAAGEAQARGFAATISVVDRMGNVLTTFEMAGAHPHLLITSATGAIGGLEGVGGVFPAAVSALSKAVTSAYLSSHGNAFSTRTFGLLMREHYAPHESQRASGPFYGMQYSQLACSHVVRSPGEPGPKASPLGLSPGPGGLPLYKNGLLVGGIGVEIAGLYRLDSDTTDADETVEEPVALAGAFGFAPRDGIRADFITWDGRPLRYVDVPILRSNPASAAAFESLAGRRIPVTGFTLLPATPGVEYATAASGIAPAAASYAGGGAWTVVDGLGDNRYPARDAIEFPPPQAALKAAEVEAILAEALAVARRTRSQFRRPAGSAAEVTVAVVDRGGSILGLVRTADAPVFGIDVAAQKARTANAFTGFGELEITSFPVRYLTGQPDLNVSIYLTRARTFLGDPHAFDGPRLESEFRPTGPTAWSTRAIGSLHRPTFPDGAEGTVAGPFSTTRDRWSPFNLGLQLDLVHNRLVMGALGQITDPWWGCAGESHTYRPIIKPSPPRRVANGIQTIPGGLPIYRGGELIGGVGVAGDGVEQDEMIAFLALDAAGRRVGDGLGNAPVAKRTDRLTPLGHSLTYLKCPPSPFLDSSETDVCAGK